MPSPVQEKTMDATMFRAWVAEATRLVVDNADHLTHLDAAIGDADHGINLSRGLRAAAATLDETAPATPGAVLATVGRALISKTGGASGPLYGTAFRAAAKTLGEDPDVSAVQLGAALARRRHADREPNPQRLGKLPAAGPPPRQVPGQPAVDATLVRRAAGPPVRFGQERAHAPDCPPVPRGRFGRCGSLALYTPAACPSAPWKGNPAPPSRR